MYGIKVNDKSITVSGVTGKKISSALSAAAAAKIGKESKLQVGGIIKRSHAGAQQVIGEKLTTGIAPLGSGTRTIAYRSPATGKGRRYTTQPWNALSHPYQIRKPVSKTFWRKHFDADSYPAERRPLRMLFKEATLSSEHLRSSKTKTETVGKSTYLSWYYRLTIPQNILSSIISYPMLQASQYKGKTHFEYSGPISRNDASMLVWLEGNKGRPFIVGLSAQIGADMYAQILKTLRRP